MSQSYPFLALARRHGVDYGDVLLFADHLANGVGRPEGFCGLLPRYREATIRLINAKAVTDILQVVQDEQQRRLSVTRL